MLFRSVHDPRGRARGAAQPPPCRRGSRSCPGFGPSDGRAGHRWGHGEPRKPPRRPFSIMVPSASIPAVRQNLSKLTETASQALSTAPSPVGGKAVNGVIAFFMALLSFRGISPFVESAPRAYRLKASNAAPPISTFPGAIPRFLILVILPRIGQTGQEPTK